MATAKPKTTKIETPVEEALQGLSDVLQEEILVEEPVVVEEPVEVPVASVEAPVEEPVVTAPVVEAPEKIPFIGDQRTWHGAQTSQRYNARIQ